MREDPATEARLFGTGAGHSTGINFDKVSYSYIRSGASATATAPGCTSPSFIILLRLILSSPLSFFLSSFLSSPVCLQYDEIPVETSGDAVPDPLMEFNREILGDLLMANLERAKFAKPTPVQKYSIPIGYAGRDMMACAQTGEFVFFLLFLPFPLLDCISAFLVSCLPTFLPFIRVTKTIHSPLAF